MRIDQYFTPDWLAEIISGLIPDDIKGAVFDPSAGEGNLLRFVEQRFGSGVDIIGADIDRQNVRFMKKKYPGWSIGRADALCSRSRNSSLAWKVARSGGVSIVVLNPPFSYRGGSGINISYRDFSGLLSPAAAFVALMLTEVAPERGIVAVMPKGVMEGVRCRKFWKEVRLDFDIDILRDLYADTFPGARAKASVVYIRPKEVADNVEHSLAPTFVDVPLLEGCRCVEIIRGRVPRHLDWPDSECAVEYLHTTDIGESLANAERLAPAKLASVGKSVILARVGNPIPLKLVTSRSGPYVLSDCLYALRPVSQQRVDRLFRSVRSNRDSLAIKYFGAGAPHLPLHNLSEFLREIGYVPFHVSASADIGLCRCNPSVISAA
ncbi:N-6 DNA methylase [Rhodococcus globerulus]|uniref:N-6 DNA methylase n=1 Tax=Rhodococcus globerulus TaxID=33008 RepID=A0ABU4BPE7_RHOGO|nr:N-6 DNA methylase [Rhodococcus globerulus]MDV6266071.1 N-6 DNA methylase [Rhodococcus globerulus]